MPQQPGRFWSHPPKPNPCLHPQLTDPPPISTPTDPRVPAEHPSVSMNSRRSHCAVDVTAAERDVVHAAQGDFKVRLFVRLCWSAESEEGRGTGERFVGHLAESGGDVVVAGGTEAV